MAVQSTTRSATGVEEAPSGMITPPSSAAERALTDARGAGLLAGDRSEHLSFRAPKALVDAARLQTGIRSTTELGLAALAMLAQPDTASAFLVQTRGRLGADHDLEY